MCGINNLLTLSNPGEKSAIPQTWTSKNVQVCGVMGPCLPSQGRSAEILPAAVATLVAYPRNSTPASGSSRSSSRRRHPRANLGPRVCAEPSGDPERINFSPNHYRSSKHTATCVAGERIPVKLKHEVCANARRETRPVRRHGATNDGSPRRQSHRKNADANAHSHCPPAVVSVVSREVV